MIKYSVLTFIFGQKYECLHEVLDVQRDVEYICVTDNKNLKSNTWKIIYDEINLNYTSFRKVIEVRYNPFKYVNSDTCLILDGSTQINIFPRKLFQFFDQNNYDIATLVHAERDNLIDELNAWKKIRNLSDIKLNAGKALLNNIQYDFNYKGLFQVSLLLVKNNNIINKLFNQVLLICNSCAVENDTARPNQTIFSAIINKYYSENIKLLPLSICNLYSQYFNYYNHNNNKLKMNGKKFSVNQLHLEYKYVFNKYTECYYIDKLDIKENNILQQQNINKNIIKDNITAVICNFNTIELTNNVIYSLLKFSNVNKIIILDNSDREKFKLNKKFEKYNIEILDNTKQKYINFDLLLKTYNLDKKCIHNNYASLKHTMSIQFLLNIVSSKYLLLCDSDIIIKKQIDFIEDGFITIADINYTNTTAENVNINHGYNRFIPFIQLFNIDILNKYNIKYFDITRIHGIINGLYYDTGASFYEDVIIKNIPYKKIISTDYITHLGHGSWSKKLE